MSRIRWFGPTLFILIVAVVVTLVGPRLAQQTARAQSDARISLIRNGLERNPSLAQLSDSFRKVAEVVEPSVVHIQVSAKPQGFSKRGRSREEELLWRFFGPHRFKQDGDWDESDEQDGSEKESEDLEQYNVPSVVGTGSGWVYDSDGHVITNDHVVRDADEITVRFHDGTEAKAAVVGTDPKTDVAVLKIENSQFHPATLAQEPVEQGDIVFAFGSPFGFEFSMSQGIVSAKGRRLGILAGGGYENFIQTDAAINRGNSGGPMTNIYGQVVGMNTAIATRNSGFQGLGFAIPIGMVKHVVDQLLEHGKVTRGYLGIYIADLNPKLAKTFGFEGTGVLVEDPIEGGPAQEAGIMRGDIITKIDDKPLKHADDLRNRIALYAPGTQLAVEVFRDGQVKIITVTVSELPEKIAAAGGGKGSDAQPGSASDKSQQLLRKLGLESLTTFTKELAQRYDLTHRPGVLVKSVRTASAAEAAGISKGQVITDVMGVRVESVDDLLNELEQHDLAEGVRISVVDRDVERFVLLELPGK